MAFEVIASHESFVLGDEKEERPPSSSDARPSSIQAFGDVFCIPLTYYLRYDTLQYLIY